MFHIHHGGGDDPDGQRHAQHGQQGEVTIEQGDKHNTQQQADDCRDTQGPDHLLLIVLFPACHGTDTHEDRNDDGDGDKYGIEVGRADRDFAQAEGIEQ